LDEARSRGPISPSKLTDKYDGYEPVVPLSAEPHGRFYPLLKILRDLQQEGNNTPLRSIVGERLKWQGDHILRSCGVTTFKGYAELVARMGLIDLIPPSYGPGTERMSLRQIRS